MALRRRGRRTWRGSSSRRAHQNSPSPAAPRKGGEFFGIVDEALPDASFRVRLEDGRVVLAHLAGKLRVHFIRVLPGDRVTVELSPYDETRGRIVYRAR